MALEKILKALANKRRLAILKYLDKNGPSNVGEISKTIRLSMKATSKHIQLLSSAEILIKEQKSLYIYYDISPHLPKFITEIIAEI
ncbi:MAG: metalloregulator ArsR/SmtB family transcription factor [Patescibacteria group bacterium]